MDAASRAAERRMSMNVDEIVQALRNTYAGCDPTPCCDFGVLGAAAAALIESLQAENDRLRRERNAALQFAQYAYQQYGYCMPNEFVQKYEKLRADVPCDIRYAYGLEEA